MTTTETSFHSIDEEPNRTRTSKFRVLSHRYRRRARRLQRLRLHCKILRI